MNIRPCTIRKESRPEGLPDGPRTDEIVGFSTHLPEVGQRFSVVAEPLVKDLGPFALRSFSTSPVEKFEVNPENENEYTLHTYSGSVYRVSLGEEVAEENINEALKDVQDKSGITDKMRQARRELKEEFDNRFGAPTEEEIEAVRRDLRGE
jgi:hypothetical protein